jgi:hypothetical protein
VSIKKSLIHKAQLEQQSHIIAFNRDGIYKFNVFN